MRKLELLKRHNDSSTYGRLVRRAQSFLITRVRLLTEVASAQPFDTEYALRMRYQQAGSMDRLNHGNPVLDNLSDVLRAQSEVMVDPDG